MIRFTAICLMGAVILAFTCYGVFENYSLSAVMIVALILSTLGGVAFLDGRFGRRLTRTYEGEFRCSEPF